MLCSGARLCKHLTPVPACSGTAQRFGATRLRKSMQSLSCKGVCRQATTARCTRCALRRTARRTRLAPRTAPSACGAPIGMPARTAPPTAPPMAHDLLGVASRRGACRVWRRQHPAAPVAHRSGATEDGAASGTACGAQLMRQREGLVARVDTSSLQRSRAPSVRQMQ